MTMCSVLSVVLTAALGTTKITRKGRKHTPSINYLYKTSHNDHVVCCVTRVGRIAKRKKIV